MKDIKLILLAVILVVASAGCSNLYYKSGNFQNIKYIIIIKKRGFKKVFQIQMNLNKAASGSFMTKEIYKGSTFESFQLINDSANLYKRNASLGLEIKANELTKVSETEYEVIKKAFLKYPDLTTRYSLNADSIKNYLGWYKNP